MHIHACKASYYIPVRNMRVFRKHRRRPKLLWLMWTTRPFSLKLLTSLDIRAILSLTTSYCFNIQLLRIKHNYYCSFFQVITYSYFHIVHAIVLIVGHIFEVIVISNMKCRKTRSPIEMFCDQETCFQNNDRQDKKKKGSENDQEIPHTLTHCRPTHGTAWQPTTPRGRSTEH